MRFEDSEVSIKTFPERIEGCGTFIECSCRYVGEVLKDGLSPADTENKVIAQFKIDSLLKNCAVSTGHFERYNGKDFSFYGSGWQSWGFGGEIDPGKKQKNILRLFLSGKNTFRFPAKPLQKSAEKNPRHLHCLKDSF
ncbi:MAG: hypothetical protein II563_10950 [Treponema sp.]|nr:hypothetical protein [Treponema sp.]